MKKPVAAERPDARVEPTRSYKKIGIAAVAAAHAIKPRDDKSKKQRVTPPILLQDH